MDTVDDVLLVDDGNVRQHSVVSQIIGHPYILHDRNYGYGRNQKSCYLEALRRNSDNLIMIHPDYQYTPKLITAMASMIAFDVYDVVLGSRIIGGGTVEGGMPVYKYIANRFLTAFQNLILRSKLSEFHTGYRAFSREVLETLPLNENSDDFVFDNEMLVQIIFFGYRIGEISCPTRYFTDASSISFGRALRYGVGVIITSLKWLFHRLHLRKDPIFNSESGKLIVDDGQAYE